MSGTLFQTPSLLFPVRLFVFRGLFPALHPLCSRKMPRSSRVSFDPAAGWLQGREQPWSSLLSSHLLSTLPCRGLFPRKHSRHKHRGQLQLGGSGAALLPEAVRGHRSRARAALPPRRMLPLHPPRPHGESSAPRSCQVGAST